MAEYIEREALLKELATHYNKTMDGKTLYHPSMALAMHDVRNAPAADVVERSSFEAVGKKYAQIQDKLIRGEIAPVVHGRYIPDQRYQGVGNCDLCGGIVTILNNYCPNCGARMDGE